MTLTDRVLHLLDAAPGPLTCSEIARRLGANRRSADSALRGLKRHGLVFCPPRRRFPIRYRQKLYAAKTQRQRNQEKKCRRDTTRPESFTCGGSPAR